MTPFTCSMMVDGCGWWHKQSVKGKKKTLHSLMHDDFPPPRVCPSLDQPDEELEWGGVALGTA